ncbi:hypothetical protein HID58_096382 [Brassica napus]|uniref:Uncharacterized protein n=1 Tax=Brassica napus TaxID=3708 RepID=A0ABQ7X327_BRANA|nr:hypothetical protein HID58_096382 [Brassica napus]
MVGLGCVVDGTLVVRGSVVVVGSVVVKALWLPSDSSSSHTQFVELKYMNRHKLKGTLKTKQKVSIRCIMCGDIRRVVVVG